MSVHHTEEGEAQSGMNMFHGTLDQLGMLEVFQH